MLFALCICTIARAQQPVSLPLLEELNRQTQALYTTIAPSVVRVRLPTTRPGDEPPATDWMALLDNKMPAEALAKLRQDRAAGLAYVAQVGERQAIHGTANGATTTTRPALKVTLNFNAIGVIVDDHGHVIVPMYTDPANVSGVVPVIMYDGSLAKGRVVASDQLTKLTILEIQRDGLHPAALSLTKPADGSVVLAMSVDPSATRLCIWSRWASGWGVIIRVDGSVAGFSRQGEFLPAVACLPVEQQLVATGRVQRPVLGVGITKVESDDPLRIANKDLGQTPALEIGSIVPNSPAERAGLRVGDMILALDGQGVGDTGNFAAAIAALAGKSGPAELQILRQGQKILVTVDLQPAAN